MIRECNGLYECISLTFTTFVYMILQEKTVSCILLVHLAQLILHKLAIWFHCFKQNLPSWLSTGVTCRSRSWLTTPSRDIKITVGPNVCVPLLNVGSSFPVTRPYTITPPNSTEARTASATAAILY
jgi:hypothetical protein